MSKRRLQAETFRQIVNSYSSESCILKQHSQSKKMKPQSGNVCTMHRRERERERRVVVVKHRSAHHCQASTCTQLPTMPRYARRLSNTLKQQDLTRAMLQYLRYYDYTTTNNFHSSFRLRGMPQAHYYCSHLPARVSGFSIAGRMSEKMPVEC